MWKKLLITIARLIIPVVLDELDKDPKVPMVKAP